MGSEMCIRDSDHFKEANKEIKIVNPISSELGVLRNSIFSNLVMHMSKNLDRGIKDLSIFEIGPILWFTTWSSEYSCLWFVGWEKI